MNPFLYVIKKDNMSYEKLGKLLGISRQAMHMIANDKTLPSAKTLLEFLILYKSYFTAMDIYKYYFMKNSQL